MNAPADPSAPRPVRRRWWLVGVVTGWVLVLVAVAVVSVREDRSTVAEQLDATDAATAVDRATDALVAAVGPSQPVAIGPRVQRHCQVTPVWRGLETSREITVQIRPDEGSARLDEIGAALPTGYRAEVRQSRSGPALRADAGDFVAVRGTVSAGVLTLRAESGCRPL